MCHHHQRGVLCPPNQRPLEARTHRSGVKRFLIGLCRAHRRARETEEQPFFSERPPGRIQKLYFSPTSLPGKSQKVKVLCCPGNGG